jgi:2-dehydropantoate 2-reductase
VSHGAAVGVRQTAVMRVVVYGAGAIGGVVGGRLFQHGVDVVLIARGEHHRALVDGGLTLESADERVTLAVPAVGGPDEVTFTADDVVLLAMKSQDTEAALDALRQATGVMPPIVCMQNGVENERLALRRFPDVYGVCVMCPTTHIEAGVVQANAVPVTGLLDVGRYPSGVDATAEAIASVFGASTFEAIPRPDIMRWKYTKLLMNLGNAIEALCARSPAAAELAELARAEGAAVLDAAGIAYASRDEDARRRGDLLQLRPIGGARRGGGSSWQSLRRGAGSIETDYLNGEIVLLGRLHGVATPANARLCALANDAARRGASPATLDAQTLLDEWGQRSGGR